MSRAVRFVLAFVLFFAAWATLLFHNRTLPDLVLPPVFDKIIPVIPLWLLVTFGSYSLANIGWALVTFGDCPDAQASLLKEIQAAKMDLRSRGVSVD
ncbi:Dolichol-phosphate mannosyltransferase subunit 3 [Polyrhizophydium stewartii]|uniref:Dolichol-phosphate mannosyltransferase subunit 3 n=1 Tax=Polyrhizophydium stewartii TaxID=2732419 RepID=A0ABR4N2L3_9FUNG|nr:hypothetical protein HK105_005525 [Polyrhizophydium stewartii]